ncbi:uncharacterized protein LOC135106904 isoform X3 [Scylla paramamosain]
MGKGSVVFVTVFTYIFLTSQVSQVKSISGRDYHDDNGDINQGPRNVRIDAYAKGNYTIFSLSHLHPNKDQYRYKTHLMACDSGSGFSNWENVLNKSLKRRFKADPYTNVTFEVREQTTGKIIAKNSTVTPAKEPEANVTSLECNKVKCQAIVENECSKYNGYNITVQFTLKPSCDKLKNPPITHAAVVSSKIVRVALRDLDLVPFTNYTVTAKLANNVGAATDPSLTRETFFISKSESPGRVSSLNVTHSTPYSLHVVWSAPDDNPPKGKLSEYKLEWKIQEMSINKENVIVNESVTSFNITGLQQNTTYDIKIVAKNAEISSYGEAFSITATTKDEGASDPSTETEMTDAKTTQRSLRFSWDESRSDNCITDYYTVTFFDGDKRTVKNITDNEIRFDGLAPGKKYTLEVEGCPRTGKCEKLKTFEKWTKPEKPRVVEKKELQTTTDTTITIQLPDLENPPGMHWILLRICSSGGECQTRKQDFSREAEEMVRTERERENEKKRKETPANGRNRRSVDPGQNDDSLRIVAQIKVVEGEDPKETAVVGSKWNGGKGLESDTEYMVLIVTEKRAGPYSEYFSCKPRIMRTAKRPKGPCYSGNDRGHVFCCSVLHLLHRNACGKMQGAKIPCSDRSSSFRKRVAVTQSRRKIRHEGITTVTKTRI